MIIRSRRDLAASIVVLAFGAGCLAWAQAYPPKLAAVPTLVAWLTIALAVLDLAGQTETRVGALVRRLTGQEQQAGRVQESDEAPGAVWPSMLWPLAYVAAVMAAGFLAATLLYVFLYMRHHGGKPLASSALAAVLTTLSLWIVFELLFRYPLSAGWLFRAWTS